MGVTDGHRCLSAEVIQHILVIGVKMERFRAHQAQHSKERVVKHDWDQESALETVCPEPVARCNTCISKDIRDIEYSTVCRYPSGTTLRERELSKRPIGANAFVRTGVELERLGRFIGKPEGGGRRLHKGSRCLGNGMEYLIQMERRGNVLIQICKTLQASKTIFQALQALVLIQHCSHLSTDRMQFLDALLYSLLGIFHPSFSHRQITSTYRTFLTILRLLNKIF